MQRLIVLAALVLAGCQESGGSSRGSAPSPAPAESTPVDVTPQLLVPPPPPAMGQKGAFAARLAWEKAPTQRSWESILIIFPMNSSQLTADEWREIESGTRPPPSDREIAKFAEALGIILRRAQPVVLYQYAETEEHAWDIRSR